MADNKRTCTFDGCERPYYARGFCNGHYKQQRLGKTLRPLQVAMSLTERMAMHTDRTGECWLWTASKSDYGYGQVRSGDKTMLAHRVAYELANGPIPHGMMIDHRCHTHPCVRPNHLRIASRKQNLENRAGAAVNSKSGVRGVRWDQQCGKWLSRVTHNRHIFRVGLFATIEEAEAAVIAKRNELFTHNDLDRI